MESLTLSVGTCYDVTLLQAYTFPQRIPTAELTETVNNPLARTAASSTTPTSVWGYPGPDVAPAVYSALGFNLILHSRSAIGISDFAGDDSLPAMLVIKFHASRVCPLLTHNCWLYSILLAAQDAVC
jgi:hypothetical protein